MGENSSIDQGNGDYTPQDRLRFQDLEDLCATPDGDSNPAGADPSPQATATPEIPSNSLADPSSLGPSALVESSAESASDASALDFTPGTSRPSEPLETARPIPTRRRVRIMIGLLFLIVLVAVNLAIGSGKLLIEKVISESMEPTLLVGDRLLCDVNAVPRRYSIVVLKDPEDPDGKLVKRIMGLPGDRIRLRGGLLYINGEQELSDKVSSNSINWDDVNIKVPNDHVFVMGDNRNNSYDSLNFGPVPYDDILGVVSLIVWPRSRWSHIEPFKPDDEDKIAG